VIYAQAPARTEDSLIGRFIYTLEYEFSGRRDPLGPENGLSKLAALSEKFIENVPRPLPVDDMTS